ncbi:T9SS type A sorting domain-containing protein [Kaistella flava (ex Peng et al. 2021)]|uniref:T9SS type A sorting domain-containing protein n=1 Tax=Kaistella flava (ex Peng et al. 2021) TaxID=2038776 RepID=A0A7M2YBU8_9FLAO|nr:T9SS type A sorting domain-containing protein [Kaistella flava (ex Peng et al. 2021)]QOW11319.1 T9SS type A sorting domain-containing protein [Kaistella flava (ex Peng et al. 2021)]
MKKIYSTMLVLCGLGFASSQVFNTGDYATMDDVSDTGVAVGNVMNVLHVMWNEGTGLVTIGEVTGDEQISGTTSISKDAKYVSGTMVNPDTGKSEMARYNTTTGTWTYLGTINPDGDGTSAWGMTSDGSAIVGLGFVSGWEAHAMKWTQATGIVDLGSTTPTRSSRANAISDDGTVIVGWQDDDYGDRFAVYWKDNVQSFIQKENSSFTGEGQAVTPDGNTIVGTSEEEEGAFVWNAADGYISIKHPDPMYIGGASGVSDDGKTVIGYFRPWGAPATSGEGFIWTKETGRINLNDYVASLGYDDLGMTFALPLGISPNGQYIAGLGTSGNGLSGFVIKLPTNLATAVAQNKSKVGIYPNPVKNIVTITNADKLTNVEVYNAAGQKVKSSEVLKNNQLDLSGLSKGAYILKINNAGKTETIKFIKE